MERRWWALTAVCTATFMLLLDITIVNVALPSIETALRASFSQLQWVVDAYALTLATLLLTMGSLADLFGRRRLFSIGLVLFTLASLACGLANTPETLIGARAAQGVGGAIMFATSLAILAHTFRGKDRATAFGLWGATTGLAVAIGPLVGGYLTEGLGWEWIFYLNIPVGIAAFFLTLRFVDESSNPDARRIDWAGVVTFSASLFLLIYALIEGNNRGWGDARIVSMLIGSAILIVAFVVAERVQGDNAMFDLALFRNHSFVGAGVVAVTLSGGMFAMFLYLVLFLQQELGLSPAEAGLRFLPVSLLSFVAAAISGRLTERVPVRLLMTVGLALTSSGLALMYGIEVGDTWTRLLPGFVLCGIGIGMVNPALASTAIGVVHPARSGVASGMNNTFRQIGIATGIAGLGAVFQDRVGQTFIERTSTTDGLAKSSHELAHRVTHGDTAGAVKSVAGPMKRMVEQSAHVSFVSGFNSALLVAASITAFGAVTCFVLVRQKDFFQHGAPQQADTEQPASVA
ncbi:MAG: MFS transporter [Thermoleophilia bacterium]|nr:MFS transporter [Thermoleophilia bacterium]